MYYVAYGMNTNVEQMAHRCPAAVSHGQCAIIDHELEFRVHADIRHDELKVAPGVLWEITDECLEALDILEGYPVYYTRKIVEVAHPYLNGDDGSPIIKAIAYIMNDQEGLKPPYDTYFNTVAEGYKAHGMGVTHLTQAANKAKEAEAQNV